MPYRRYFLSDDPFPDTLYFPVPPEVSIGNGNLVSGFGPDRTAWSAILVHPSIDHLEFLESQRDFIADQVRDHPGSVGALAPDGSLHWGKIVAVRVSPEAAVEWMRDSREIYRVYGGRPDRPPDVDTPTTRSWLRHPGEPESNGFLPLFEGTHEVFPIQSIVHHLVDGILKILVTGATKEDGSIEYQFRVKVQQPEGRIDLDKEVHIPAADITDDTDWLGGLLAITDLTFGPLYDEAKDPPLITWYEDFAAQEAEAAQARREMLEFYSLSDDWDQKEKTKKPLLN